MANKRIKDLSTTAAVTASDDFIAVDGATNGTRKLDAYSPTFGGNLTVSGTGNSSVLGNLAIGQSTNAANARLNVLGANNAGIRVDQGSYNYHAAFEHIFSSLSYTTEYARIKSTGNFLVGTVVDSGALLQVGTNTTAAAGGMVFGTDTFLFRRAAYSLQLEGAGSSTSLILSQSGVLKAGFTSFGTTLFVDTIAAGDQIVFRSGAQVPALTLDSSQNATFAGNVTIAASKVFTHNGQNGYTLALSTTADRAFKFEGSSSGNDYTTSFTNAGAGKHNLSCSGSIAIGNTVQTAAAVASTHKVTISIGGVTYYLLATNV